MSDIPEPWRSAMIDAGMTDPRNAERISLSALARQVGTHTSTISAMISGVRETKQETVDRVAEVLRVDPRIVAQWVGRARTERDPFKPHPDANLMDSDERAAVNRIIGLFVERRGGQAWGGNPGSEDDGGGPTPAEQAERKRRGTTIRGVSDVAWTVIDGDEEDGLQSKAAHRVEHDEAAEREERWDKLGEESQDDGDWEPS